MKWSFLAASCAALALSLAAPFSVATEEQAPIDISRAYTVPDPSPPTRTFHNYGPQTVTLTNTFGATAEDDSSTDQVIAKERATLKGTPPNAPYIMIGSER